MRTSGRVIVTGAAGWFEGLIGHIDGATVDEHWIVVAFERHEYGAERIAWKHLEPLDDVARELLARLRLGGGSGS